MFNIQQNIINSYNQDPVHHIHCLGCIFYHQSMIKKFWFRWFLFYDFYSEFCSLNASKIYDSAKHPFIHYDVLLQQHFHSHPFLFLLTLLYIKNECIFEFNPISSLIPTFPVSSFVLTTSNSFESNHNNILTWLKNY